MNSVPYQSTVPNLEDLEAPRRQTSLDGESIKIVIHDVDSGPTCASKRRVILRRDPADKAHRSKYIFLKKKKPQKNGKPSTTKKF
jgi:hypothetical protein